MAKNIVKCPQCGTDLDVSSFQVGQKVACPCGVHITVPPAPAGPGFAAPLAPGFQPPPGPGFQPPPGPGPQPPFQQPGAPPISYPMPPYGQATVPCKEASDALTLAIIGIFCVGIILGPIAISKASKAKKMIQADPRLMGEGKATAAMVIGIIVTIYNVIVIISALARFGSMNL